MTNEFLLPAAAKALRHGNLTEVSAFTPIIQGRVPGERRTYEERLRFNLQRLTDKINNGIPSDLHLIHTLHFGRITIIRPEQYRMFEHIRARKKRLKTQRPRSSKPSVQKKILLQNLSQEESNKPEDDYCEGKSDICDGDIPGQEFQTWVLTQVVFDGDIKAYFRDIANRLNTFFDGIYNNCELYPGTKNFEEFWQWICTFQIESDMFYAGNPDLSVTRVRELEDFKRRFDLFVTKVRSADGTKAANMDELFDEFLMETRQRPYGFPAQGGVYTGALDTGEVENER